MRANFALTAAQKADTRAAIGLLEGSGVSLTEAARRAIEGSRAVHRVTVAECVDAFLRTRLDGRRGSTFEWYNVKLGAFAADHRDAAMDAVTRAGLREWLAAQACSESTRASFARAVRTLWRWAIAQEPPLAGRDVTSGLRVSPPAPKGEPGFLPVAECAAILRDAGAYLPAVAAMLFAGVRPHEIAGAGKPRLAWAHVNAAERLIRVPAEIAKTGRARILEGLPNTLWVFLGPPGPKDGALSPVLAPALIEKAAELAGYGPRDARVRKWPHDALRHTFATYAIAGGCDLTRVSLWMGHEGRPSLLHQRYRGLATKAQAEAFFALRPDGREGGAA